MLSFTARPRLRTVMAYSILIPGWSPTLNQRSLAIAFADGLISLKSYQHRTRVMRHQVRAVSSGGWRPSTMLVTISGARNFRRANLT